MFEDLLKLINEKIREAASSEAPDYTTIRSLLSFATDIGQMTVKRVDELGTLSQASSVAPPIYPLRQAAYGPAPLERYMQELNSAIGNISRPRTPDIAGLATVYLQLKGDQNTLAMADRILYLIDQQLLKMEKETKEDEDLHSKLPG